MSLNLESISKKMTDELDKAVAQKPVTGYLADNNLRTLYVSGEESAEQIKMRANRLGIHNEECTLA